MTNIGINADLESFAYQPQDELIRQCGLLRIPCIQVKIKRYTHEK